METWLAIVLGWLVLSVAGGLLCGSFMRVGLGPREE